MSVSVWYVRGLSIISAPLRQFYRIESLQLSGHPVITAVLRIAIKEAPCIRKVINNYYISITFSILEWRKPIVMSTFVLSFLLFLTLLLFNTFFVVS